MSFPRRLCSFVTSPEINSFVTLPGREEQANNEIDLSDDKTVSTSLSYSGSSPNFEKAFYVPVCLLTRKLVFSEALNIFLEWGSTPVMTSKNTETVCSWKKFRDFPWVPVWIIQLQSLFPLLGIKSKHTAGKDKSVKRSFCVIFRWRCFIIFQSHYAETRSDCELSHLYSFLNTSSNNQTTGNRSESCRKIDWTILRNGSQKAWCQKLHQADKNRCDNTWLKLNFFSRRRSISLSVFIVGASHHFFESSIIVLTREQSLNNFSYRCEKRKEKLRVKSNWSFSRI